MHPKNRTPSHPGEILLEEFLKPLGVTKVDFAAHIGVARCVTRHSGEVGCGWNLRGRAAPISPSMKVLLVEDDERVQSSVARGLQQLGFQVEVAADGRRGLQRALAGGPELVVLDLLLPLLDGNSVLLELRRSGCAVPVLVLSARDGVGDRVHALDAGADDYLVKPFSFDELLARLRALARRPSKLAPPVLEIADLRMDLRSHRVERGGRSIALTAKEFALLEYMLRNRGTVLTRTMMAEHVWDQHFGSFSNVIEVYIRYLRAKVDSKSDLKLIHTVRGVGYVLADDYA